MSILTNTGAMVALQTLKGINSGLEKTQSEIATGKSVANAKDNAAVWAISKVMESDVTGFRAISDSLALGESTVAVAQQASETITDLLTQMKEKIVAANGDNVDRTKLNNDVTALKEQIESVVRAAQFNGLNLVDGSVEDTDILSSLDRDASGAVTVSDIKVGAQNLSTGGYLAQTVFEAATTGVAGGDKFGTALAAAATSTIVFDGAQNTATGTAVDPFNGLQAGDTISLQVGGSTASVTVTAEDLAVADADTNAIIAVKMKAAIEATGENVTVAYDASTPALATTLVITNAGTESLAISGSYANVGSGGLGGLAAIDVSTAAGATAALGAIEGLTQTAIDAAAAFGSDAKQIEIQANFVSKLTDSFKAGIGSMVDANMEEASARLQALQVQQQLGIQALSIANQAPQSVLSLFR